MERNIIINEIKDIISETTDFDDCSLLSETTDLLDDKGLNSMDAISILVAVEDKFNIEINDEDLSAELVRTLGSIADYVEKKMN